MEVNLSYIHWRKNVGCRHQKIVHRYRLWSWIGYSRIIEKISETKTKGSHVTRRSLQRNNLLAFASIIVIVFGPRRDITYFWFFSRMLFFFWNWTCKWRRASKTIFSCLGWLKSCKTVKITRFILFNMTIPSHTFCAFVFMSAGNVKNLQNLEIELFTNTVYSRNAFMRK
jgi:hypothetical protein